MMETLLSLPLPWSDVQAQLERAFSVVGLDSVQSFDLQSARESLLDPELCPCPYHTTTQCTCQYIVFIVRQKGKTPISLEVHGYDDSTYVSLVPTTGTNIDEGTMNLVRLAMDQVALAQESPST